MAKYSYVPKTPRTTKSSIVDDAMDEIYQKHGEVTPKLLVNAARNRKHPLHSYFEWDDSIAAEKWREDQAFKMILASKFILLINQPPAPPPKVSEGIPVRKLLPMFDDHRFKLRDEALNEKEVRAKFIQLKIAKLRSWCTEVSDIEELADLKSAIEKLLP